MKKLNCILTLLLLAMGLTRAMADDQTLSLGNYEEVVAGDWNEDQCYQGSWWMIAPTQFYVKHTGSQFIYTKEQLAQMAGKEVKGMSFVFYNQSSFSAIPRTINVWVKEIDDDAFAYNDEKKAYAYFDFDDAEKVLTDYAFDTDFVDYYCLNGELNLAFDKAFAYSGDKNLLVTITFDGDETAETSSDIEFYYNTDAENMAMSTNSDNVTFADYHESEDWPYAKGAGYTVSHATQLAQPLTQFTYQEAAKPEVKPAELTGTVSCDGEPQEGAVVKLTATDDSKLVYKATTGTDGTYRIKVVKSDKTYTLEVTCGGCEDYSEKNVTFTPGEDTTKNIIMTKTPEPENSITLGKYDKMLADGTGDDVYVGHGYSWAAAPTNFSHSMTGSQIIYTKEQLAKMGGKAITQVNFIFRNECAYGTYPRTVKVWAQEIDDANFDYDDKACLYMFYDYKDATVAVAGMEYAGELYDLIGNGELEIAFDKPINYSGNKNLLLTFTFEGTECCNTLDFNFFYNADMPKKAMSYFSDRRSFDEYAESVDWPYVNDDCTPKLEQPITRFFYTDAVTDNIDSTNSGNRTATGSDAMYNLAGQRVSKTYKGIVVKNGKKYVN